VKGWLVVVMFAGVALGQTKPKAKAAAKVPAAVWSQDVMRTFGVLPSKFADSGLSKLTQPQLDALIAGAKPKGTMIACRVPVAGQTRLLMTVAGSDATPAIVGDIKTVISGVAGVSLVDTVGQADATLRIVVQAMSINQKTIGYTASYVVGSPCSETTGDKKTDVELKGVLGSTMNSKSPGLAQDLASAVGKELRAPSAQQ
jgi:hypothetical protein